MNGTQVNPAELWIKWGRSFRTFSVSCLSASAEVGFNGREGCVLSLRGGTRGRDAVWEASMNLTVNRSLFQPLTPSPAGRTAISPVCTPRTSDRLRELPKDGHVPARME